VVNIEYRTPINDLRSVFGMANKKLSEEANIVLKTSTIFEENRGTVK